MVFLLFLAPVLPTTTMTPFFNGAVVMDGCGGLQSQEGLENNEGGRLQTKETSSSAG